MSDSAQDPKASVRVLLIKRNEEDAAFVRDMLAQADGARHEITWVSTRQAATEALAKNAYDVALVGYRLADCAGIALIRHAATVGWPAPFILFTGSESREADFEAIKAGATDCLVQDQLTPNALARAIRYSIAKKEAVDTLRSGSEELTRRLIDLEDEKDRVERHGSEIAEMAEDLSQARDELQAAFQKAEESERRYRTLAESSPVGIWQVDTDGRSLYMNPAMCALLEVGGLAGVEGKTYDELITPESVTTLHANGWVEGKPSTCEIDIVGQRSGALHTVEISAAPLMTGSGEVSSLLSTVVDITERKKDEETIRHMARHDALTGLPNRTMFQDRLQLALVNADRVGKMAAVLYLDLDHFKDVNDTLGHPVGDLLLKRVSERLMVCARESDTVARLGGDEFAIIATNLARVDDVTILAKRINETIAQPFNLDGQEVHTATSIGITLFPNDTTDPEKLLSNADMALYRAKDGGRSRYQFYDAEMDAAVQSRKALEHDLRRGLENQEFELLYQPQVDLRTGDVVGAEALIRWNDPERGLVMPNEFIALAESNGLIVPMTEWILLTACSQAKAWQLSGLPPIRVGVNISAVQFKSTELISMVTRTLKQADLSPQWLELEITESVMMGDIDRVVPLMNSLRDLGVKLAVDDFGTGFSSLTYLKRFPVEKLKIDQSFVRNIVSDPDDAAIAKTIVRLGQGLNITVIAEGVETVEQLSYLKHLECDQAQGYYFARPIAAPDFARWVREFRGLDLADVV